MPSSPLVLAAALTAAYALAPVPAVAAGLAYDSVTKFSMNGNASAAASPVPGSFQADFTTASTTPGAASEKRGPFGLGKMMAQMNSALAMFKNGTAEKHYAARTKSRVDNLAARTADITDCTARTVTHLDLAKNTYAVTSLDASPSPDEPRTAKTRPEPAATPDDTKVAIAMTTKALGAKTIEGVATMGYDTAIVMTATRPGGESSTTNMALTAYYSALPEPHVACDAGPAVPAAARSNAQLADYALLMRAMRTSKGDPRFTVSTTGPALPSGRVAMFEYVKMAGDKNQAGGFGVLTERGDVRAPLADTDPVFGIPPGFTKVEP